MVAIITGRVPRHTQNLHCMRTMARAPSEALNWALDTGMAVGGADGTCHGRPGRPWAQGQGQIRGRGFRPQCTPEDDEGFESCRCLWAISTHTSAEYRVWKGVQKAL